MAFPINGWIFQERINKIESGWLPEFLNFFLDMFQAVQHPGCQKNCRPSRRISIRILVDSITIYRISYDPWSLGPFTRGIAFIINQYGGGQTRLSQIFAVLSNEEAQDALDRDNFLEPTEHKEKPLEKPVPYTQLFDVIKRFTGFWVMVQFVSGMIRTYFPTSYIYIHIYIYIYIYNVCRYVMLCCVVLCCVVLRYVRLCYVMSCYVTYVCNVCMYVCNVM